MSAHKSDGPSTKIRPIRPLFQATSIDPPAHPFLSSLSLTSSCHLAPFEYLRRCKKGAWKKEHTIECLKCFNLERNIDAGIDGVESPDDFSLEQYTNAEVVSTDDE
ncbi:hypothetical protein ACHAXN_000108 [Cyclotella atomus]